MNEVLQYLQSKQEEMLAVLKRFVELESPSREKALTDRLGVEIAKRFTELTGGSTTVIKNDLYGNHIRGEWGSGEEQILLLAHFDTVWQHGDLEKMPFRITEGKAYGPGIFDMKGGLVQGLYALHALHMLRKQLCCKVVYLFTSDEEIGSPTSRPLIEEEAKKSKYVLVLEPSMSPNGALKTSRKGVGMFHLKVKGQPAHSGIDHDKGRSAIEELARQISYLHSLTDYSTGTTVNVGVIRGGTTSNVVAAEAEAEIDLRITTQAEAERLMPVILGLQPQTEGTGLTVTGELNRPPLERTEQVAAMYQLAKKLAKEELNFDLPEAATGGASDGNFTAPLAPTIDGLGAVGDGAHAVHEHLVVSEMPVRSALVALLLASLGGQCEV
ncbi:M20 family metallopeptidase [Paenactinomyces guangxiensis]|uniref:M20 family metallopeptidase n=1 Tax=Paenactinomyces guangxiensis TaxID=1490290 RepID=A0A7W1WQP9_9BACL|nr:M20 family metallopeptidase [Paenactinomyces guangxiensis]MBA4494322.1 M20 family metallopeptidase [Paenactinomyces guangxiensis]MBH8590817.1 M20 family metallopeptidase [Paenactinomyces guangxiensis]